MMMYRVQCGNEEADTDVKLCVEATLVTLISMLESGRRSRQACRSSSARTGRSSYDGWPLILHVPSARGRYLSLQHPFCTPVSSILLSPHSHRQGHCVIEHTAPGSLTQSYGTLGMATAPRSLPRTAIRSGTPTTQT